MAFLRTPSFEEYLGTAGFYVELHWQIEFVKLNIANYQRTKERFYKDTGKKERLCYNILAEPKLLPPKYCIHIRHSSLLSFFHCLHEGCINFIISKAFLSKTLVESDSQENCRYFKYIFQYLGGSVVGSVAFLLI